MPAYFNHGYTFTYDEDGYAEDGSQCYTILRPDGTVLYCFPKYRNRKFVEDLVRNLNDPEFVPES